MASSPSTARVDLDRALSVIAEGHDDARAFVGGFADLIGALHLAQGGPDNRPVKANHVVRHVYEELWTLQTIALRLDREHQLTAKGDLDSVSYHLFAGCDVKLFLVVARSLLDYVAQLIELSAHLPGQMSGERSFNALRTWVLNHPSRLERVLGLDLTGIVRGCDWFEEVKEPRDALVHRGGRAFCSWSASDEISFDLWWVSPEARALLHLCRPSTVGQGDFRIFAAITFARIVALLEEVSPIVLKRLSVTAPDNPRVTHSGLGVLERWMTLARAHLVA